jgi:GT2 family glycosyltransferase
MSNVTVDISVVILSFNSEKHIGKCLSSLFEATEKAKLQAEVFVVENGSVDNSMGCIKGFQSQYGDSLHVIDLKENTGTTYSRNQALKQATGKYILVLDSDAYVNDKALMRLISYLDGNQSVGLAVPKVTYASGNFQLSCDKFPTLWGKAKRFLFLKKIEQKPSDLSNVQVPTAVDYAISACWMLPKHVVDKVGLLDEKIFYSPEDVDYCIRVWKSGYKIHYLPDVSIIHDAQELSRGFKLNRFHFSHLKGIFYLMKKHGYFWGLNGLYKRIQRS